MELKDIKSITVQFPLTDIYTFSQYQTEALVTASMGKGRELEGFVRVCGLVGEAAELRDELAKIGGHDFDGAKTAKELGDVLWYAATLSEWLGLGVNCTFDGLQSAAERVGTWDAGFRDLIIYKAGKLAELMKKHLGHDKPMSAFMGKELELMQDVLLAIAYVANTCHLRLTKVAALNINKLRARYQGGGFTSTLANAHVDETTKIDLPAVLEDIRAVAEAREREEHMDATPTTVEFIREPLKDITGCDV